MKRHWIDAFRKAICHLDVLKDFIDSSDTENKTGTHLQRISDCLQTIFAAQRGSKSKERGVLFPTLPERKQSPNVMHTMLSSYSQENKRKKKWLQIWVGGQKGMRRLGGQI